METIAYNFHDENDSVFKDFKLTAGKLYYFFHVVFKLSFCVMHILDYNNPNTLFHCRVQLF